MNVVQIIFSPTGGTRRAAEIIAAELGTAGAVVDLTEAGADFSSVTLNKDDVAIIAVPSFAGRGVPALAASRLAQIRGGGAACVALCVYGNRAYEDTLLELSDAALRCGFRVAAGVAAVAEHSVVRAYAAGRPDEKDAETLKSFAREIAAKIRRGADGGVPAMPGNRPYKELSGGGMLVPRAGDKRGRPIRHGRGQVRLMYALRLRLPALGPRRGREHNFRRRAQAQGRLLGQKRAGAFYITA